MFCLHISIRNTNMLKPLSIHSPCLLIALMQVYIKSAFYRMKAAHLKLQSHYSDNQSPTSDNHFFLGGCRRLSEVGKCLSMIADQSAIGCQRITSTTSRRPPTTTFFGGVFRRNSVVGKWLSMIADQSAIGRRLVVRTVGRWEVFVAASKTFRRPNFLSACSPPAVDLN